MIENNSRVRALLGSPVRVLPPVSQSSMTQSVNGRMSQTITLLMSVVGPSGATAQVSWQGSPRTVQSGTCSLFFVAC